MNASDTRNSPEVLRFYDGPAADTVVRMGLFSASLPLFSRTLPHGAYRGLGTAYRTSRTLGMGGR